MSFLKKTFRCNCPVTSALDIVGDKWTLVIIKQMLLEYKTTFKDFYDSDEAIAPNILSERLKKMQSIGLIDKLKHPTNRKTNIYILTEKGLTLTPIVIELALWAHNNITPMNQDVLKDLSVELNDKNKLQDLIINKYVTKTALR
ncbi:helix-turn-helix transcriptional regulator [Flavobacteriales bacterium]|nr:helix-turn-helix transcriptional regulator [Flavobacteriales bacterium]MDB2653102.1 helix-turn-helix transcriptional regulator [Flavobacteriales bacterium]